MVRAILFDMDGVLMDSFDVWLSSFNAALAKLGRKKVSREYYRARFGTQTVFNMAELGLGKDAVEYCDRLVLENVGKIKFFSGAKSVLEWAHGNFKTALVTNTREDIVNEILSEFGISRHFDAIITGSDIKRGKPDPEMILKACSRLGVKPAEAIMVGDMDVDIGAGHAAGCRVVGVGIQGDWKISKITELKRLKFTD